VRVVIAPDSFSGTLTADEAAGALAEGWRRGAPADEVTSTPPARLGELLAGADLVVTGEGSFDWRSLRDTTITEVAEAAAARGVPCLVLAGQVSVGRREAGAIGVTDYYAVAEHAGGPDAALADPAGTLAALAEHVAARWSGSR
jgi:glycerate kinase